MILEDDIMIASGVTYALEAEGYEAIHATDVRSAIEIIGKTTFNLAILDMQLPDGNGFDVSKKLMGKNTPVIFLTVVDDESNIVKAFDEGADDYVVKPFRIRELIARVKRTLEKHSSGSTNVIEIGSVKVDVKVGKVFVHGKQVELTALEYRLLLIFANNRGTLMTRAQILEKIWDIDGNFVEDNTLTVYVKRLREKLGDAIRIETVRGIGYRVD